MAGGCHPPLGLGHRAHRPCPGGSASARSIHYLQVFGFEVIRVAMLPFVAPPTSADRMLPLRTPEDNLDLETFLVGFQNLTSVTDGIRQDRAFFPITDYVLAPN